MNGERRHKLALFDRRLQQKQTTNSLLAVPGIKNTSVAFRQKLVDISNKLGINPDHLATVISFETGGKFSSSIRNKQSGATGLIQFMPNTAKGLGTTTSQLAAMTPEQQLDYVYKYMSSHSNLQTLNDVYMAVLYPSKVGSKDTDILFEGDTAMYRQNIGFDKEHKGYITVGDVTRSINGRNQSAKGERVSINAPPESSNVIPFQPQKIQEEPTLDQEFDRAMQKMLAASYGPLEKIVRNSIARQILPTNKYLIVVEGGSDPAKVQYASTLSSALRQELDATTSIYRKGTQVQIECELHGSRSATEIATKAICEGISDAFKIATSSIGGCEVKANVYYNKTSSFNLIDCESIECNNRIFKLAMVPNVR